MLYSLYGIFGDTSLHHFLVYTTHLAVVCLLVFNDLVCVMFKLSELSTSQEKGDTYTQVNLTMGNHSIQPSLLSIVKLSSILTGIIS